MHSSRFKTFWALVAAAVTGLGLYTYLGSLRSVEQVVVAAQEIPARTVITAEMLATRPINRSERRRFFPRAFQQPQAVADLVSTREIAPGEVLQQDDRMVSPLQRARGPDGKTDASYFIPPELRAVTVTIDSQGAVGDQLRQGHRVDVIFTPRDRDAAVAPGLLLAKVEVFVVQPLSGKGLSSRSTDLLNVTLLVTPEQAVAFNMAKRQGYIDLALAPLQADPAPWIEDLANAAEQIWARNGGD